MSDLRPLRDRTREAITEMLPEAPNVVVAFADELPDSFRCNALAYTGKLLDLAVRPFLGFTGRSVVVVVDEQVLTDVLTSPDCPKPFPGELRGNYLEAVCHEVGHLVDIPERIPRTADEPDEMPSEVAVARIEKWAKEGEAIERSFAPWLAHAGPWVRCYLHVIWRMERALGCTIVPHISQYELSAWRYQVALDDEPERLANVPLTEVRGIAPPMRFIDQWKADVDAWFFAIAEPTAADFETLTIRKCFDHLTTC